MRGAGGGGGGWGSRGVDGRLDPDAVLVVAAARACRWQPGSRMAVEAVVFEPSPSMIVGEGGGFANARWGCTGVVACSSARGVQTAILFECSVADEVLR